MTGKRKHPKVLKTMLGPLEKHLPFLSMASSPTLYDLSQKITHGILQAQKNISPAAKRRQCAAVRRLVRRNRLWLEQTQKHPWPGYRNTQLIQDLKDLENTLEILLARLAQPPKPITRRRSPAKF